jgi:hypothetical protein
MTKIIGLISLSVAIAAMLFILPTGVALAAEEEFPVSDPPFSEDLYPCSDCHGDMDTDLTQRDLEDEHDNITLEHAAEVRWCLDCHDPEDRDSLHLQNGDKVSFYESYRLCGQCHGTIYRDWRAGVHGRRTGFWNGQKEYLLCAHCHDPHSPKFKALAPDPPPDRPLRWGQDDPESPAEGH